MALLSAGKVASFRMQVSRTTRKVGPGASQRPCASLRFDECNRLGLGHRLAPVLAVRAGQRWGQLEPDNLAADDGRRINDISVREGSCGHKRSKLLSGRVVAHPSIVISAQVQSGSCRRIVPLRIRSTTSPGSER